MSIREYLTDFHDFLIIQKQRSIHTAKNYCMDIKQWLDHHPSIANSTNIHIDQAKSYMVYLKSLRLSHRSIHRKLSALDQFCEYLIHQKYIQSNPWKLVRRPRIQPKIPVFADQDTVFELLDNYPQN